MKKLVLSLVSLILLVSLTACGDKGDSLTYLDQKTNLSIPMCAAYAVQLGTNATQATVTAELWENGTCTESTPLSLSKEATQLTFSVTTEGFGTEDAAKSLTVQLESDDAAEAVLAQFELPQTVSGYAYKAYEEKEAIPADPGTDCVLGVINFDIGTGVLAISPQALQKDPTLLDETVCTLVIRVAFKM